MTLSNIYKAPKGLIKVSAEVDAGIITSIRITGDFFMIPEESIETLENHLKGVKFSEDAIAQSVSEFYSSGIITPMLGKEDIVKAIVGAKDGS